MRPWTVIAATIAALSLSAAHADTSGTATITSGQTSVEVAHTGGGSVIAVLVTPSDPFGRANWVSDLDADSFVINLPAAAADTANFTWRIETEAAGGEDYGEDAIDSGQTSVTVSHDVGHTPIITIQALDYRGAIAWVSNITTTAFTINIPAAQPDSASFSWFAETGLEFIIEWRGYVHTDTDCNDCTIVTKPDSVIVWVSGSQEVTARFTQSGPDIDLVATGVTPGIHTYRLINSVAGLRFYVDDVLKDSSDPIAIEDTGDDWVWMGETTPYWVFIKITTGGALVLHYEPQARLTDQWLPNRESGGDYPGEVVIGGNPENITITLLPLQISNPTVASSTTGSGAGGIPSGADGAGFGPGSTGGGGRSLPGFNLIASILDTQNGPYKYGFIALALAFGVVGLAGVGTFHWTRHLEITEVVMGAVLIFFVLAGVLPWWAPIFFGIWGVGVVLAKRSF
jgi:uncharacterized membrane protein YgcG